MFKNQFINLFSTATTFRHSVENRPVQRPMKPKGDLVTKKYLGEGTIIKQKRDLREKQENRDW